MLGIIQEQHPDRGRLFMQWKHMTWPILVDSLNVYEISVVPITYAIDQAGIVRYVNPSREEFRQFMAARYEVSSDVPAEEPGAPDIPAVSRRARASGSAAAWTALGDALFHWGGDARLDEAIDAFDRASRLDAGSGSIQFRLGTALRRRHETEGLRPDDFRLAVGHWARALELNPNQYIWRRRLQQYGPRLDKPYPFYDWVDEARRDVRARGETPAALRAEPVGTEVASPVDTFDAASDLGREPDARGRIIRDNGRLVLTETAVVPPRIEPGRTTRVHVLLRPNAKVKAHWNNEVEPLRLWVSPPKGWEIDRSALTVPNPPETLSTEVRQLQFELRSAVGGSGVVTLPAYALYYVCEDVDGTCLYRRQDVPITVRVGK